MVNDYNRSPQEVLEELHTSPLGLTAAEAAARLAAHGPNKLKEAEKPSLLRRFLAQLKDPMLLMLMAAAAISAVTNALSGESFTEVFIILAVVLLNAVLGVVQESKAEAAIEALQTMTAAKCKVLRDGHQTVVENSQLVPGDVVVLEAGDAIPADGRLLECVSLKIEEAALPGVGTCSMLGTANTMSCLAEALGMSLPGCGLAHAVSAKKRRIAKQSGRRIVAMVKEDLTPRKIMTREALRNAIRVSMAMGASTNSTLHLPAIAHEAGIHITLDDFDELSREIPYLCNIKPSGQYPLSVLEEQGGVPAVMKALERKLDLEQMTVSGKTVGENLAGVELVENDVIFSLDHPKKPEGGLAILHGNLAPKGAVVKQAGVKPSMHYFEGQARVFTSMEEASWAVSNDKIQKGDVLVIRYEGPKGGPGMREMHMTCSLIVGRGMDEDCALVTDGRFSGSTRGPCIGHVSPEAAAGGPIAAVEEGDRIIIDIPNRTLTLCVPEEEIQRRLERVRHIHKPATPALERYAALVTSADQGAVLQLPRER